MKKKAGCTLHCKVLGDARAVAWSDVATQHMHILLLHWQLETWTFWDGIFVIAKEGIWQSFQILPPQRCGCGAVFLSSWEASGQHYIIREIIKKLQKMLFVLMKKNSCSWKSAEDVWFLWDLTGQYLNLPQGRGFAPPPCAIFYLRSIQLGLVSDLETVWT